MQTGDLVKAKKFKNTMGIVVEVFEDLDVTNPWVKVLFTHPIETYRWCKKNDLTVVTKEEKGVEYAPLAGTTITGSL